MNLGPEPFTTNVVDIFISYSSSDAGRVLPIADQLERAGMSVWLDRRKIPGAAIYGPEIVRAIKQCRLFALMCSDASVRSRNVNQEILLAWKYEKPYLPLLLAPISFPEQIEYWVEGRQWIEILDHPPEVWTPRIRESLSSASGSPPDFQDVHLTGGSDRPLRGLGAVQANSRPSSSNNPAETSAAPIFRDRGLAGLRSLAGFTDRIWPLPAEYARANAENKVFRGLGAPQDHVRRVHRIGSRVSLAIESEREGHLLLLDEGPEGIVYCLCPSLFAPDMRLRAGRSYLPQPGSPYDSFVITGRPGRELILAVITDQPLGFDWLPHDSQTPARVLNQSDLDALLARLRELEAAEWTALSTYFEITE